MSTPTAVGVAVVLPCEPNVVPQSRDNVGLWDGAPLGLISVQTTGVAERRLEGLIGSSVEGSLHDAQPFPTIIPRAEARHVFSASAEFVAETASLLYRRMPSCATAPGRNL